MEVSTTLYLPGITFSGGFVPGGLIDRMKETIFQTWSDVLMTWPISGIGAFTVLYSTYFVFAAGFAGSFVAALFVVRSLLAYVSRHDFRAFAYYRIVFGLVVLATATAGWVDWSPE